jgi:hypothetical protein
LVSITSIKVGDAFFSEASLFFSLSYYNQIYYITYRSYKNFDYEKYVEDLEKYFVNIGNESDINSACEIFEKSYLEVVNKHIPLKKRKPVQNPAPFSLTKMALLLARHQMSLVLQYISQKNSFGQISF